MSAPSSTHSGSKRSIDAREHSDAELKRLSGAERKARIEDGRIRFRHRNVHAGKRYVRMFCDHCTVDGDDMYIVGDHNTLYGKNNRFNGIGNTALPTRPPPPPPPSPRVPDPPPPLRAAAPPSLGTMLAQNVDRLIAFAEASMMAPAKEEPMARPHLLELDGEPKASVLEELQCVICTEKRPDVVFDPCKHLCCCRTCARQLYKLDKASLCPLCRKEIKHSSIVFF